MRRSPGGCTTRRRVVCASSRTALNGGGIRTEKPRERCVVAQCRERLDHLRPLRRGVDVDVEDVFPGTPGPRPRLELRQAQVPLGERAETAVERAGNVADAEDERR